MLRRTGALLACAALAAGLLGGCKPETPAPSQPEAPAEEAAVKPYYDMGMTSYNTKYVNTPFYSDRDDNVTYAANAMWEKFGTVSDGTNAVTDVGGPAWYEWNAVKLMWSSSGLKSKVRAAVLNAPMDGSGYLWSWWNLPHWEFSDEVYHYDTNPKFIAAVYQICAWEGGTAFLDEKDTDTIDSFGLGQEDHKGQDKSQGKTVWEKTKLAMDYMLSDLQGSSGLLVITNPLNTGRLNTSSSNYWDNLPFGYKDPYEGALFLNSLQAMTGLCEMRGDTAGRDSYAALFEKAKKAYDETYWSAEKGRYVSTIDADGTVRDYGLTFLNLEALHYGAGDAEKAKSIFDWLDGRRILEGEDSTGADIYSAFTIAPRVNTVRIESVFDTVDGKRKAWWHGPSSIDPFTTAKYGTHCENGGTIFYTSYYDMMARIRYNGADDALKRFAAISGEYAKDELMRDPSNDFGQKWIIGVIGEFPESGLVPLVYLHGFLGVNAGYKGLEIRPQIPEGYKTMGVKEVVYGGKTYGIRVDKDEAITITSDDAGKLRLAVSNFKKQETYTLEITDAEGKTTTEEMTLQNGELSVEINGSGKMTIVIR